MKIKNDHHRYLWQQNQEEREVASLRLLKKKPNNDLSRGPPFLNTALLANFSRPVYATSIAECRAC